MGRKKNKSPAQAARTALVEQYGLKNSKAGNYWFVRCPLTGADWLFDSDLRAQHFYACESDASVLRADYTFRTVPICIDGGSKDVRIDARVELADGAVEMRRMQTRAELECEPAPEREAAIATAVAALGARYRLVTVEEIDKLEQRIRNWQRGYRYTRATRLFETATTDSNVRVRLELRRQVTLQQLIAGLPLDGEAHVVASVMRLHRQRLLTSDLDINPLGQSTVVRWKATSP